MFVDRSIDLFPTEPSLLEWVISTYENHPDSPYEQKEIAVLKERLEKLI